jgi:phage tail sheath protein FI
MPTTPTYPGVYIEEVPSGVRTLVGVATSITAFVGRALRGPVNEPVRVQSFAEFERTFGGLWVLSTLSYSVQHYFLNGGTDAIIVRVAHTGDADPLNDAATAEVTNAGLTIQAMSPGAWGSSLRVRYDDDTRDLEPGELATELFNITVKDMATGEIEVFRNVSTDPDHRRFVSRVLDQESRLVVVDPTSSVPSAHPAPHAAFAFGADPFDDATGDFDQLIGGLDGTSIDDGDVVGNEAAKTGIYALETADLFNLLCLPPLTRDADVDPATLVDALAYCKRRRAMLMVDPPAGWNDVADVLDPATGVDALGLRDENAILYFPRVRMADPLKENKLDTFAPSGAVAGVIARTDGSRGVWKAPAGQDAVILGARELSVKLTDGENGQLNPMGVNCLRTFPVTGNVVWGARTLEGADRLASEWKYVPVRRLALFIEESLYRGTQWVVFEPNDEPLWAQIRLNVGAFMHNLFRQGAFQGTTPREAYLVKCDRETTTQNDIDRGIVNVLVGFAPLKPAEFVIIRIQQLAGQIAA